MGEESRNIPFERKKAEIPVTAGKVASLFLFTWLVGWLVS